MAQVHISDAVREVLGTEGVARARAVRLTVDTRCAGCHRRLGTPVPATNLVVKVTHGRATVQWAHTDCLPSTVYLDRDADRLDLARMDLSIGLVQVEETIVPILVASLTVRTYGFQPGGDLVDMVISHMLEAGFALASRLEELPDPVAGWTVRIGDGVPVANLRVLYPDGGLFYDGTAELPPGWYDCASELGWCVLYVGSLDPEPGEDAMSALASLARAGELAGARVTVELPQIIN